MLWGGGVRAGVTWDGTLYRDATRYPIGGQYFWCSYFKPGSHAGIQQGYWINFGKGWSHLHNDDPAQLPAGASQRVFWDMNAGHWALRIEATQYVTHAVIPVWVGVKAGGNDPTGVYTRISGCDPTATLTIEAL